MPERQVITSLTGTAAPLLTVDVSDPRELDYASLWLPRDWKRTTPYVTDVYYLDPNGAITHTTLSHQDIHFELPKVASLTDDVYLESRFPPHQVTPLGAQVRYTDWLGLAFWERFNMRYGANEVFEIHPEDEYIRIRKTLGLERLESMRERVAGDQTSAQLQALLVNGTGQDHLITPIYVPFGDELMCALPIVDLSQKTRYSIRCRSLSDVTYNPTNAVLTPQGPYQFRLVFEVVHLTGDETAMFIRLAEKAQGISYMIHQHQRQESEHATTLTGSKITSQLRGITRPIMFLNWALIPSRLRNNTGFNDYFMYNPSPPAPFPPGMNPYSRIDRWGIDANGQTIQREVHRRHTVYYNYDKFNHGFSGEDMFDQMYAQFPHATNVASGYLDYANLSNATLNIHLGPGGTGVDPLNPAMPQQLTLMVNCKDYNFWFIKGGNLTRCFN